MDTNRILYDYIVARYGNVVDFSNDSGISLIDLNAVLLKDNISEEIGMGLELCDILNIDIEKMVSGNKINDLDGGKSVGVAEKSGKSPKSNKTGKAGKSDKSDETAARCEIYKKCVRLSEIEKKKILEYIESILNEKNEND